MYRIILVVCLWLSAVSAKHEYYDGHALVEVNLQTEEQTHLLHELEKRLSLDIWSRGGQDTPAQVLVPGVARELLQSGLDAAGIEYKVVVENIKEKLDREDQLLSAAAAKSNRSSRSGLSFDTIHRYDVVDAYLVELAQQYPGIVTVVSAGTSREGRDIKYLRISTTNFQDNRKPIVFLESLIHAREWISLPVTLYAIEKLVIDVQEQDLLENIDWIISPIANPDGYEYTHTTDRFWRKNRATGFEVLDYCSGVDLNRNFDSLWSSASSSSVCDETFHGTGPFSEPETAAVRDIMSQYSGRIELFLDFHSYGSVILFGYGDAQLPPNALILNLVAVRIGAAIDTVKWPSNPFYVVGNSALLLSASSGSSDDYGLRSGIPLSYAIEMPAFGGLDTQNSFLVDPAFIEQAGFETWQGIKTGARYAVESYTERYAKK